MSTPKLPRGLQLQEEELIRRRRSIEAERQRKFEAERARAEAEQRAIQPLPPTPDPTVFTFLGDGSIVELGVPPEKGGYVKDPSYLGGTFDGY